MNQSNMIAMATSPSSFDMFKLTEILVNCGGTIFGGFVRDMVAGQLDFVSDIDVSMRQEFKLQYLMARLIKEYQQVLVSALPVKNYGRGNPDGFRLTVDGIDVDIVCEADRGILDLDVNGLLWDNNGLRLDISRYRVNGDTFVQLVQRIQQKQFRRIDVPLWRERKVAKLKSMGWTEV